MRDPNRLDNFYEKLKELHKTYCPDWRFGQLIINFINWHYNIYKADPFYIEENECLDRFEKMIKQGEV